MDSWTSFPPRRRARSKERRVQARAVVFAGVLGAVLSACGATSSVAGANPGAANVNSGASPVAPAPRPSGPLTVSSSSPASGAANVPGTAPVTIHFSTAVPAASMPQWQPAVAGKWAQVGPSALRFTPSGAFAPGTAYSLSLPAGLKSRSGATLAKATTLHFTVEAMPTVRLQQILAQLGYLPVGFKPTAPVPTTTAAWTASSFAPVAGTFYWRFPGAMAPLQAEWTPGPYGPMTTGAVMTFQATHGMSATGQTSPAMWSALLTAAAQGQQDPRPYTWVQVSKSPLPEMLTLWQNGKVVLTSLANTGVPAMPTPDGSFPIYVRYRTQTMSGTNPNGTHYTDPGIPYVNYFHGGDAIHGYIRSSYGYPQSVGCVELPVPQAAAAWNYLHLGTVVTVTG
ncbi:MAG: Ig-like domain-containing protein [Actinomycetota bacterium]|nr:Ig-like domain-containing protein [Actinomycetota bacterium]